MRRVGNERTKAAIELLHNVLAYLKPVNSDNESQNLKNRCSATYNHFDIHEARLEYELKVLIMFSKKSYVKIICEM